MRDVGAENLASYFRFGEHRTSKSERGGRCEGRLEKERGRCGGKRKTKVCRRTEGTGFKCNLLQSRRKLRAPSTRNAHVCPSLGEHACSNTAIDCNVRTLISREFVDDIYACIREFFSRTNHTATIRINRVRCFDFRRDRRPNCRGNCCRSRNDAGCSLPRTE